MDNNIPEQKPLDDDWVSMFENVLEIKSSPSETECFTDVDYPLDEEAVRLLPEQGRGFFAFSFYQNDKTKLSILWKHKPSPPQVEAVHKETGRQPVNFLAGDENIYEKLKNRSLVFTPEDIKANEIMDYALQEGTSDIHLTVGMPPKIRRSTELVDIPNFTVLSHKDLNDIAIFLVGSIPEDQALPIDIDKGATYAGRRLRISLYKNQGSLAMAIRVIPEEIPSPEDLLVPQIIVDLVTKTTQGMILVCGPTGSGKSTTLASLVDVINHSHRVKIITIEDPIEYIYTSDKAVIHQREVGVDTASFDSALVHALRQDPDIILIGEMRDPQTMKTAVEAAETGHLVLATVHARNVVSTVERIINVFPEGEQQQIREQMAKNLVAIVVQKLVAAAPGSPTSRRLITEILILDAAAANNIRERKIADLSNKLHTDRQSGSRSFTFSLAEAVLSRQITQEEARRHIIGENDMEMFQKYLALDEGD